MIGILEIYTVVMTEDFLLTYLAIHQVTQNTCRWLGEKHIVSSEAFAK